MGIDIFRRHHTEVVATRNKVDVSPLIDPATGEEKVKIERACLEYLQDPNQTSIPDFITFTSDMIELLGRKRRTREEALSVTSNPLVDQKTDTAIVLRRTTADKAPMTIVSIKAISSDKEEELSLSFSTILKNPFPSTIHVRFNEEPQQFDSYIKGGKEEISKDILETDLELDEVKDFARRIFDVYQKQGQQSQQTQPPTPQP